MVFFFLIIKNVSEFGYLSVQNLILFAVFLLITNFAKPSLIVCFTPAAFLLCLYYCLKNQGEGFRKYILVGCAFLFSLICIPFQYDYLYGEEAETRVAFTLDRITAGNLWEWGGIIILSLAFPLITTIVLMVIDDYHMDVHILFAWTMYLIALFLRLFFEEVGARSGANNFAWSTMIGSFFLFMILMAKLYKVSNEKKSKWICVPWLVYAIHICSGVGYFKWILDGNTW